MMNSCQFFTCIQHVRSVCGITCALLSFGSLCRLRFINHRCQDISYLTIDRYFDPLSILADTCTCQFLTNSCSCDQLCLCTAVRADIYVLYNIIDSILLYDIYTACCHLWHSALVSSPLLQLLPRLVVSFLCQRLR